MAASGALRNRKPDSVQFWLAIAAVSFLFHALLIVGIKRWVTTVAVEPDAGPIAVELVEPAASEAVDAPLVQATALKPEVKPEVKPDLKSEVQPEFQIKSEPKIKPEPIVPLDVKAEVKKPAIISTPKPDRSIVPPKKNTSSGQSGPKKDPLKENQNSSRKKIVPPSQSSEPIGSSTQLPPPGEIEGPSPFSASTDGQPKQLYGNSAALKMMPLPPIVLSDRFAKNVGKTLNISVSFFVKCPRSQKLICEPSFIETELQSQTPPSGLTSEDDLELEAAIEKWFALVKVSSLVFDPDLTTAMNNKAGTTWNIQVTLKVKS